MIAQHMARDEHARLVLSLLNKEGRWPAIIPDDQTQLEGGRVYLLPAEHDGAICAQKNAYAEQADGLLCLLPPAEDSYSSPSVNRLLKSLADHYGDRVLALILSGAGSDGAQGCRVVKQKRGLVWVQSPEEARYNSMPQAASEAVSPDFTGTLAEISEHFRELMVTLTTSALTSASTSLPNNLQAQPKKQSQGSDTQNPAFKEHALKNPGLKNTSSRQENKPPCLQSEEKELEQITHLIEDHTGISFSGYKQETLLRRIDKRKSQISALHGASVANHYAEYLEKHHAELELLEQYLLVSVSSFFRDADVFRALALALIPVAEQKREAIALSGHLSPFRILVAGCATGEEAYSLAIICRQLELTMPVEIVAVDLNREAIRAAKKGVYSAKKLAEVPPELVARYFERDRDAFILDQSIRDEVDFVQGDIFAQHFDKAFDFVSCRNLMIYLKREQQDQLIHHLHQQMNSGAGFVIGLTESLSPTGLKLFSTLDHFHRIFKRR